MNAKKVQTGRTRSVPIGVLTGLAAGLIVTAIAAAICAAMMSKETIPEKGGMTALVILLLGSVTSAWIAFAAVRQKRMQVCLLSGVCYYGLLIGCTALFFGGQYQSMGVTAVVVFVGCMTAALPALRQKKSRQKIGKKYRSR